MREQRQAFCNRCQAERLHARDTYEAPHVFHLLTMIALGALAVIFTLSAAFARDQLSHDTDEILAAAAGFACCPGWLFLWGGHALGILIRNGRLKFRCQQCGHAEGELTEPQQRESDRLEREERLAAEEVQVKARQQRHVRRIWKGVERRRRRQAFWAAVDAWLTRQLGEGPAVTFFGSLLRILAWALPIAAIAAVAGSVYFFQSW